MCFFFFFQAEDGIRDAQESRGLGDVYKRQVLHIMFRGRVYKTFVLRSRCTQMPQHKSRAVPLEWMDIRRPRHSVLVLFQATGRHMLDLTESCYFLLEWQDPAASSLFCLVCGGLVVVSVVCHTSTMVTGLGVLYLCWHTRACTQLRWILMGLMRWGIHGRQNKNNMLLQEAALRVQKKQPHL
eukprot:TRINITY_DN1243_c0_g1_i5.p1 TRINITY_DN1243_c0_g1~~TRINITY_DN1243_c0_g1_i5.p1  ORF type:complete len:183 (-),score=33.14 TRINITY_DN1243_c0_g1_i5:405-953(-)